MFMLRLRCLFNLFVASAFLLLLCFQSLTFAAATNPMDGLTSDEVFRATQIARASQAIGPDAIFPVIRLKEWPKDEVYSWRVGDPISRAAFVVAYIDEQTIELDIDLDANAIIRQVNVAGVQPAIMTGEWHRARQAVMSDPRLAPALARRGIEDPAEIFCSPQSAGLSEPEIYGDKRILRVNCYSNSAATHPYGLPVPGLHFVVDAPTGEVIDMIEDEPFAMPDADALSIVWPPAPVIGQNPVVQFSPEGVNFKLSGSLQVEWNNWSFHMRVERREGPVISLVKYNDNGTQRNIAYQIFLSEMYVPYNDPGTNWRYRTFLDSAEFGLGSMVSSLVPGSDCPQGAAYISIGIPNDVGGMTPVQNAICIFERATGDPIWRHGTEIQPELNSRASTQLVVRMIPTVGNYDYPVDYVFTNNGSINIRVGATGFDAVKTVRSQDLNSPDAEADTTYGNLIAPHTVAPFHDHYYSFYVDLDVDGINNSFDQQNIVRQQIEDGGVRRSLWRLEPGMVTNEGPLTGGPPNAMWSILNHNQQSALGHSVGYEIGPHTMATSMLSEDDDPQRRAAFSSYRMWATIRDPNERYASGEYPIQAHDTGLPQFVADQQSLENADIVVWPTIGFRHITRTEDWPILSTMWFSITIRPYNFFDSNPSISVQ